VCALTIATDDIIKEQLMKQSRLPEQFIDNASFSKGTKPVDPRKAFEVYKFENGDLLHVKSKLKGGSHSHNHNHNQ
jgi:hypothetical protein